MSMSVSKFVYAYWNLSSRFNTKTMMDSSNTKFHKVNILWQSCRTVFDQQADTISFHCYHCLCSVRPCLRSAADLAGLGEAGPFCQWGLGLGDVVNSRTKLQAGLSQSLLSIYAYGHDIWHCDRLMNKRVSCKFLGRISIAAFIFTA
jgi:hypothetical protein